MSNAFPTEPVASADYAAKPIRGVWYAPFRASNGDLLMAALDRHGRRIAERPVPEGDTNAEMRARDELWAVLDVVDPQEEGASHA